MPEEAWAAQSMEAAAEHIVSALRGKSFATRRMALLLVVDNLGSKPSLAPAISLAVSARSGSSMCSCSLLGVLAVSL